MKLAIMTAAYAAVFAAAMALLYGTAKQGTPTAGKGRVLRITLMSVCAVMWAFPLAGALIPDGPLCWFFQRWGNVFLGFLLYYSGALLLIRLCLALPCALYRKRHGGRSLPRQVHAWLLAVLAVFSLGVNLLGYAAAHDVKVTRYELSVRELGIDRPMRLVLIADLHIGVNSTPGMYEDMVRLINEQEADLVLVAGDIVTSSFGAMGDPERWADVLGGIRSHFGTYVVYGNHDVNEPLLGGFTYVGAENAHRDPAMPGFLEDCGWKLLQDETATVPELGGLCIAGRRDLSRPGDGVKSREDLSVLLAEIDPSAPILLLQHEPAELEALDALGVDLAVGGHTHDGQIFPGNVITRMLAEQSCGMKQWGDCWSVVTSGVGYFGPPIRVGTVSEIAVIDIR
ncbi:MAG: metallophosphoesterase [Oscillospiraceae bacterium]|nr:metallophosphoesterase [Oscillospiraceae bacterium]